MTIDGQLQRIIDELVSKGIPLEAAKKEFEKKYVAAAVTRASGNMGRAARSLGIHRNTLRAKISLLKVGAAARGRDNRAGSGNPASGSPAARPLRSGNARGTRFGFLCDLPEAELGLCFRRSWCRPSYRRRTGRRASSP